MTIISAVPGGSGDAFFALIEGLRLEFGCAEVGALAERIFESEKAECHRDARVCERYLGQHFFADPTDADAADDLSRVAILSFLGRRWHAGACIVDGEGSALELLWMRSFERATQAKKRSGWRAVCCI